MRVPLVDLRRQHRELAGELEAAVAAVLRSGTFVLGEEVRRFEAEVARCCGVPQAVGVASGTDALVLALRALGVGAGDEVITSPFTFIATAAAVLLVGARPVFADIEPETMNLDPERLEAAVTPRTRAIVPVHLFGHPAEMDAVNAVAAARGLAVVEDACQAIGAEYRGRRAGALGSAGCFSFYPTKNLGGCGDGGLVTTADPGLAEAVRLLRNHGSRDKYRHVLLGYNSRLDEVQAAVLRVKLRRLEGWTEARRARAAAYGRLFREAGLEGRVRLPAEAPHVRHVFHQYTVRVRERDELRRHLAERGVETAVHYPLPLHLQEACAGLGYGPGSLPAAEEASRRVLSLPMFPELTEAEQEYVVAQVAAFFRSR